MMPPLPAIDTVPVVLAALAAVLARSHRRLASRALAGGVVLALALAGLRRAMAGGVRFTELQLSFKVVTLLLLAAGAVLVSLALRPAPGASPAVPARSESAGVDRGLALHLIATVLALLVSHLHLLLFTVLVSAGTGWWWARRGGWPVLSAMALLLLTGCWYLLARVAGPLPLALAQLREAPYGPPFELGMAAALLAVAAILLGLVPFHTEERGPLTPILGAAILVRLAGVALPSGVAHWQPLGYPLVLLTALWSVVTRRTDLAFLSLGAVGLLSGDPAAGWGGMALVLVAIAFRNPLGMQLEVSGWRSGRVLAVGLGVLAATGLVPVLAAGLAAEAVYTTLIAGTAVVALLLTPRDAPAR